MKIAFDGRVLAHRAFSGVENYSANIYTALRATSTLRLLQPRVDRSALQQIWEHVMLPFSAAADDLLFCPANIAPLWLPRRIRLVLTLHDVAFKTFPESVSKAFALYYRFLVPRNIRRAEQIITVSEAAKREILRFYPEAEGKLAVIPLGLHKKFTVLSHISKQANRLLYVGSVNERKNVTGVIEAFERLPAELHCTLVVVGNFFGNFPLSDKSAEILARAAKNKNIRFKEGVDDEALIREYNKAGCFIFPSFYEGFGLPPLEAMACGTPVITSHRSAMPEVCGDAALYADPHDPEDMAEKMQRVIQDEVLRQSLIARGLERARQYTWEKAAEAHLKVFERGMKR